MSRANISKKHKVFVYGTLRPSNAVATHVLSGYRMHDYGKFPYIVEDDRNFYDVVGNIIEVTSKQLTELDRIEGVKHGLFRRIEEYAYPIGIAWDIANEVEVFVYVADNIVPPVISSGDWFNRE